MIHWQWSSFDQLTGRQLYTILAARAAVFVVEQNCPYLDTDGYDYAAEHLTGWVENDVAAYLRLLGPDTKFREPSLGRIITTAEYRGTGAGRTMMAEGLRHAAKRYPGADVRIGAQERLQQFYESFGFRKASEMYLEDGIPHIEMVRPAS
jgi:ElaA protein